MRSRSSSGVDVETPSANTDNLKRRRAVDACVTEASAHDGRDPYQWRLYHDVRTTPCKNPKRIRRDARTPSHVASSSAPVGTGRTHVQGDPDRARRHAVSGAAPQRFFCQGTRERLTAPARTMATAARDPTRRPHLGLPHRPAGLQHLPVCRRCDRDQGHQHPGRTGREHC